MKIYLTDQSKKFKIHLDYLKRQDILQYDIRQLTEKTTSIAIHSKKDLKEFDKIDATKI